MNNFISRPLDSIQPSYFDRKYDEKLDYWDFETSPYEKAKYNHTLSALPAPRYKSAFEIGCSIGVLTQLLSHRCDHVLAVDVSSKALEAAQIRCQDRNVTLLKMQFPREEPERRSFDLVVVSEVGYYWSQDELRIAQKKILKLLQNGGDLVLVHWTSEETDYPLTGSQVHQSFRELAGLKHLTGENTEKYNLDVFRRASVERT